jgi:hypothetical protein
MAAKRRSTRLLVVAPGRIGARRPAPGRALVLVALSGVGGVDPLRVDVDGLGEVWSARAWSRDGRAHDGAGATHG